MAGWDVAPRPTWALNQRVDQVSVSTMLLLSGTNAPDEPLEPTLGHLGYH